MMLSQYLHSPEQAQRPIPVVFRPRHGTAIRQQEMPPQTDFLAQLTHDIRLPVSNIVGMSDLLLGTELSETQREYLRMLRLSANATLDLVNKLLDVRRMKADGMVLEAAPFDLRDCLAQTLPVLQPAAAAKGLSVQCDIDPAVPAEVIGDGFRLRQVVMNLLDNAIKFTWHGSVRLQVRHIASNSGHTRLHFAVIDNGIGIPEARQTEIFSPYVQADASTTRHYGGSGLGLAIVVGLVDKMGGTLVLESEPGQGSVFEFGLDFDLPRRQPEKLKQKNRLQVLIADDDPISRQLARHVLLNAGHEVHCVASGAEAVAAVGKKRFDLLLMDVQMPGMSGQAATRLIRQREKTGAGKPWLPIIALSAGISETRSCLRAGMDDCLLKPINPGALMRAIERSKVPVIDWDALHERANGDQPLLAEIAHLFAVRSQVLLSEARTALLAADGVSFNRTLHILTGMFQSLSAEAACQAAAAFEDLEDEPVAEWEQAFYRLECEVDRLGFALGKLMTEGKEQ